MPKKKEQKSKFWPYALFLIIGFVLGILLMNHLWNEEDMYADAIVIKEVPTELCEYKTAEMYYKGECQLARDLVDLERQRDEISNIEDEAWDRVYDDIDEYCSDVVGDYLTARGLPR